MKAFTGFFCRSNHQVNASHGRRLLPFAQHLRRLLKSGHDVHALAHAERSLGCRSVSQQLARDDELLNLGRAFVDAQRAHVAVVSVELAISDSNLASKGFTKYVKTGNGTYEKTAGGGTKQIKRGK